MPRRLTWGSRWGMAFVTPLMAWALLVHGLAPVASTGYRGIPFVGIMVAYLVGGLLGGAVMGACLPLVRHKIGAYVLGFLAGIPFAAVAGFSLGALDRHGVAGLVFVVSFFCLLVGGPIGVIYRRVFYQPKTPSEPRASPETRRRSS